ncbi:MaoC family dehydratase [Rhodococcus sp. JVH1]|uniref:MaoC family dehydratase n=1 Tax=Rhodococcus sp. JVH1 TaxID=745408 RepID=UPI000271F3E3|nr:MaoC family dehydratase [Rhodococcus sp. JVH1]EJI99153.1 nodulation protein N [Rhodococcus sp. JVH1]
MPTTTTVDGLTTLIGTTLNPSDWFEITQDRITTFADATNDHQWIHVDPERASTESPFRRTIAHGYLTLSLLSVMFAQVLEVQGTSLAVNYGLNKVRFPAPVPAGSKVRLNAEIISAQDISGGVQIVVAATVECSATDKPVCVAEPLYRYHR